MSIEQAIDKASELIQADISTKLPEGTPEPDSYLVGNYVGREELLAQLPAITFDARNTNTVSQQEGYEEQQHELYCWAFIGEVNIEYLHRYVMRYAEAMRNILRPAWGSGWHDIRIGNTLYTGVFDAGHFLVQGCRIEFSVKEIVAD